MEDKQQELQAEKERILAAITESEKHIEHHKKTIHWDKKRLRLVEQQIDEMLNRPIIHTPDK